MKEYKIVTVCNRFPTEPYYTLNEFIKSVGDEHLLVLGTVAGEYGGLGSKPRLLYEAIMGRKIKEKYLIFCDCFDLVFSVPPSKLFLKYKQFAAPLVISAEKNCFPAGCKYEYDVLAEEFDSPYKYLNSGMIVGEVEAMVTVLESMGAKDIPNDHWDGTKMIEPNDQEYYQAEFLKQPVQIILDRYQILCNTLHDVMMEELEFREDGVWNNITKTYPCSFHLNGGAKTGGLREPILKSLNLF